MKYLQKSLPGFGKMALCYASLGQAQALQSELMAAIIDRVFLGEEWDVRSETAAFSSTSASYSGLRCA